MRAIFCWYFTDTVMVLRTRSGIWSLLLILWSYTVNWKSVHLSLAVHALCSAPLGHEYSRLWAGTAALGVLQLGVPVVLLLPRINVNTTLFLHVTLISKVQSTSDLDYFHARDLSCSSVKSHNDPISNCCVDSACLYTLYIHCVPKKWRQNSNHYNYGTTYQN